MKLLSVIIVNYNVSHFLEQCLLSVMSACENIDAEVIVVDNNSVDGSVEMVRDKFPGVKLIANEENAGFSKANNQGINVSAGKYVLLLNPDTVVEPDTFSKCVSFMEDHPEGGGLGVYMVNGKGEYLPESKRSLPTPHVAFYKTFGMSALFPKSKRFGKYHLGYLDKDSIHEVEVLSGAFMLLRRETLDKTGLLDETFFMYGEDIDLSYRILQAGYKNYYFPGTRIIHYKGESTRKSSLNYVFIFYQAMIIFARKHFTGKNARLFSMMIHLAIYFRAAIAIARRTFLRMVYPVTDIALLWGGIYFIKQYWASNVRFGTGSDYPAEYMLVVVPAYIAVWIVSMFFSGAYDRPVKTSKVLRGMGIGTLIILVVYALLPESMRYSRALIILSFFWASVSLTFYRYLLNLTGINAFRSGKARQRRFAIIGSPEEAERVASIVRKTDPDAGFIGMVNTTQEPGGINQIGHIKQLDEIVSIYNISELIFCLKDLDAKEIISMMTARASGGTGYRIAPPESMYLVGSGAIHTTSDLYLLQVNSITSSANHRNKRFFDVVSSFVLLILFPFFIVIQRRPAGYLRNCFRVLSGKLSWVGYEDTLSHPDHNLLPAIRKGVLKPADGIKSDITDEEMLHRLNLLYARDYTLKTDAEILARNIRNLGNK